MASAHLDLLRVEVGTAALETVPRERESSGHPLARIVERKEKFMPYCKSCHTEEEDRFDDLDSDYCVGCTEDLKDEEDRIALEDEFPHGLEGDDEA